MNWIGKVPHLFLGIGGIVVCRWKGWKEVPRLQSSNEIEHAKLKQIQHKLEFYEVLYHGKRKRRKLCLYAVPFSSVVAVLFLIKGTASLFSPGELVRLFTPRFSPGSIVTMNQFWIHNTTTIKEVSC